MNFKIFALFAIVLLAILPFGSSDDAPYVGDGKSANDEELPKKDERLSQAASPECDVESLSDGRKGDKPPWAGNNGKQINVLFNCFELDFPKKNLGRCHKNKCKNHCRRIYYKMGGCLGPNSCRCKGKFTDPDRV